MYDWNGDGQFDSSDSFIEYQIFNETTGGGEKPNKNPGGCGCGTMVVCLVVLFCLIRLII